MRYLAPAAVVTQIQINGDLVERKQVGTVPRRVAVGDQTIEIVDGVIEVDDLTFALLEHRGWEEVPPPESAISQPQPSTDRPAPPERPSDTSSTLTLPNTPTGQAQRDALRRSPSGQADQPGPIMQEKAMLDVEREVNPDEQPTEDTPRVQTDTDPGNEATKPPVTKPK